MAFAALLCLAAGGRGEAASSGGATIENSVTATYTDARGHAYATASNAVVATVATVAAIVVSPKESKADAASESVPAGQPATRTFVVYNGSNIPDAYRVTAFSAGSQSIASMKWVLADGSSVDATNGALSPAVAPGASISLTAAIPTSGLNVGAQVAVTTTVQTTASGTINGLQSDSGQEWIVVASAPALSGPDGANSKIAKTVNKSILVQSQPGSTVTFDIVAKNSGGSPAQDVVVTDTVPDGLNVVATSAKINGQPAGVAAAVQGQTLTVKVGTVNAGAELDVSFDASLPPNQTLGESFTNIAGISANGLPPQQTTPANVLAGAANIVFDGYGGASHPISGATIALLDQNGNPVTLLGQKLIATRTAFAANATDNPVVTGADGTYGFALAPSQVAPNGSKFYLTIDAPGYLNRRIELDISPGAEGELYNVKAYSRDGQPLAAAGGFALTNSAVQLKNVFGLFGNLPLFQSNPIDVTKTADRQSAQPGDRIMYTVAFSNLSNLSLDATTIVDTLPAGLVYAPGSARLDGKTPFEPAVNGRTLTWNLASLPIGGSHTLTYATVVFPSVAAGTTLTNAVAVSGSGGQNKLTESGGANVSVIVDSGVFSDRRVVTGHVFVDARGTGHFIKGDSGVAGVRVYLEDGSYATTDVNGMFSFASVRPGMHVLRIDATTLPAGVHVFAGAPMGSTRAAQRLLHGVLDVTTMEDVEFAVQGHVP